MKNGLVELHTQPWAAEQEWTADGIPVLHAVATLPRPEPVQGGICRRIDRFYRLQSRAYLRYCERFLFPQAREECRSALAASAPFTPTEAELTYQVTYNEGGLWSLYTQSREGGAPAVRRGDTWDLATGSPRGHISLNGIWVFTTPSSSGANSSNTSLEVCSALFASFITAMVPIPSNLV